MLGVGDCEPARYLDLLLKNCYMGDARPDTAFVKIPAVMQSQRSHVRPRATGTALADEIQKNNNVDARCSAIRTACRCWHPTISL